MNGKRTAWACIALAAALAALLPSCHIKNKIPADPALVAAYRQIEDLMDIARAGGPVEQTFEPQLSYALEEFMKILAAQKERYPNVQQGADLHRALIGTGDIFARSAALGFNPDAGSLMSIAAEWT